MFQSFEETSDSASSAERVSRLRQSFADLGIDAVLVPRADAYQGEYVPASAERLAWLTGFTGSAGTALITKTDAIIFVDGRYTVQLAEQIDASIFRAGDLIGQPPAAWIEEEAPDGTRLGIDPWLHTPGEVTRLDAALESRGGRLVFLPHNPIDAIWENRPDQPRGRIAIQPETHAGRPAAEKIADLQRAIAAKRADAAILTDPSSIAWTFNIRGSDVPHTPHPLARAILPAQARPEIFIEADKLGPEEQRYLGALAMLRDAGEFQAALAERAATGARLMVDPALAPQAVAATIRAAGGHLVEAPDPARIPRAVKNAAEIAGARSVHRLDGAAMVRFLAWLDRQPPGSVDEIAAAERLETLRRQTGAAMQMPLKDISFDTISSTGPNAAVNHYRVNRRSNRRLCAGELFLVDSGGQYVAGTTDITRTVPIGEVSDEPKRFYTLVLKGMIAIARLRFPEGTRGVDIDAFARIALWNAGADYDHGTGHGVGAYLSVHEGPASISRRGMQPLLAGMILSNEPGYYRPGAFGIRIENLILVQEAGAIDGGDRPMHGFETLTLCPIDTRPVIAGLMTTEEIGWLDTYHARVRDELMPLIDEADIRDWLAAATRPIG